jgi:hypothetical protein
MKTLKKLLLSLFLLTATLGLAQSYNTDGPQPGGASFKGVAVQWASSPVQARSSQETLVCSSAST